MRGEVAFADLLGLAALIVKAPPVFKLIKDYPEIFVGKMPHAALDLRKNEEVIKHGKPRVTEAIDACGNPDAVARVVSLLFPAVSAGAHSFGSSGSSIHGRISEPSRLQVALQALVSESDVSLKLLNRYIRIPEAREEIIRSVTAEVACSFINLLGDTAHLLTGLPDDHRCALALEISKIPDIPRIVEHERNNQEVFKADLRYAVLEAIERITSPVLQKKRVDLGLKILGNPESLSVASNLIAQAYLASEPNDRAGALLPTKKTPAVRQFSRSIEKGAQMGTLLNILSPHDCLWTISKLSKASSSRVYAALKFNEPELDGFARAFFHYGKDSVKGLKFGFLADHPGDVGSFVSPKTLRGHAKRRLSDKALLYPDRAAWKAFIDGATLYAVDGTEYSRRHTG